MLHVYPLNDKLNHVLDGTQCHCNPEVSFDGPEIIVIHNAFDSRELMEESKQIMETGEL